MTVTLDNRALGWATLARQHLLTPTAMSALDLLGHLYGLQAQSPMAPYFALWARMSNIRPEQLSELILDRRVVRISSMRGTVHALSAGDALELRPLTQPVMQRDLRTNTQHAAALRGIDFDALAAYGRELVEDSPLTMVQLRHPLGIRWPDRAPESLAHAVRDLLPLVQVPPRGVWGLAGQPALTTLQHWLGRPLPADPSPDRMMLRYLAAYGPATVRDVQAWSGLTRLGEVMARLRPQLAVYASESGTELFDLPDAPRPDPATPASVRILAPFDSVLLSYADRSRILDDAHKKAVFTANGIVRPTVLMHGRVAGTCSSSATESGAVLAVSTFVAPTKAQQAAIEREGMRLLRFAHPEAGVYDVRLTVRA